VSLDPLPGPPGDIDQRRIALVEFSEFLYRTHGINRNPRSCGNSGTNRFDAPDGSYKVLYLGLDPFRAFIETFAHAAGTRAVTTNSLKLKALSHLTPIRPLRVIDLTESGCLFRIGADARLFAADYRISQLWSKALHDHPAKAQGLLYPSRLDPSRRSIALFDDREPGLVELERVCWYATGAQRKLLAEITEHYQIELIESHNVAPRKPASSERHEIQERFSLD
jgi:hypothetical protein